MAARRGGPRWARSPARAPSASEAGSRPRRARRFRAASGPLGGGTPERAGCAHRGDPVAGLAAEWLPVPDPLPESAAEVRRGRACDRRGAARTLRRLPLPPRRGRAAGLHGSPFRGRGGAGRVLTGVGRHFPSSWSSIAFTSAGSSGVVSGRNRRTTSPSRDTRNFSKFHWMSPASPSSSACAVSSS